MKVVYFNIVVRIFSVVAIFYFFNYFDTNEYYTILKYTFIILFVIYFILLTLYDINIINYNNELETDLASYISTTKVVEYVLTFNVNIIYVSPKIYDSIDFTSVYFLVGRRFDILLDPDRNGYSIGQVRRNEILNSVRSFYE
jgi:hypothetical protein